MCTLCIEHNRYVYDHIYICIHTHLHAYIDRLRDGVDGLNREPVGGLLYDIIYDMP